MPGEDKVSSGLIGPDTTTLWARGNRSASACARSTPDNTPDLSDTAEVHVERKPSTSTITPSLFVHIFPTGDDTILFHEDLECDRAKFLPIDPDVVLARERLQSTMGVAV